MIDKCYLACPRTFSLASIYLESPGYRSTEKPEIAHINPFFLVGVSPKFYGSSRSYVSRHIVGFLLPYVLRIAVRLRRLRVIRVHQKGIYGSSIVRFIVRAPVLPFDSEPAAVWHRKPLQQRVHIRVDSRSLRIVGR